jgi:hypothetical protein
MKWWLEQSVPARLWDNLSQSSSWIRALKDVQETRVSFPFFPLLISENPWLVHTK